MSTLKNTILKAMWVSFWYNMILKPIFYLGIIMAVVISWEANHEVGWAIGHGLFSWFYVFWETGDRVWFSIIAATVLTQVYVWYNMTKEMVIRSRLVEIVSVKPLKDESEPSEELQRIRKEGEITLTRSKKEEDVKKEE